MASKTRTSAHSSGKKPNASANNPLPLTVDLGAYTYKTIGFGPFDLHSLSLTDPKTRKVQQMPTDFIAGLNNAIIQKTIMGTSTITLQFTDPLRKLVQQINNGGIISQGVTLSITDENNRKINFTMTQFVKASDQIQLVFESQTVNTLRSQRGVIGQKVSATGVTAFMQSLAQAPNAFLPAAEHIGFLGPDYAQEWAHLTGSKGSATPVAYGRGTTADPAEDSWTCLTRLASGVGWRLWEDDNIIYFGPDEFWLGILPDQIRTFNGKKYAVPPVNALVNAAAGQNIKNAKVPVIREFTETVQLIDYDWDVNKPYAQATVTCMLDNWQYKLGQIIEVQGVGPGSGYWMISGMQRDMFLPQATLTLQVPMPFSAVYNPTSAPLAGFPLTTTLAIK